MHQRKRHLGGTIVRRRQRNLKNPRANLRQRRQFAKRRAYFERVVVDPAPIGIAHGDLNRRRRLRFGRNCRNDRRNDVNLGLIARRRIEGIGNRIAIGVGGMGIGAKHPFLFIAQAIAIGIQSAHLGGARRCHCNGNDR